MSFVERLPVMWPFSKGHDRKFYDTAKQDTPVGHGHTCTYVCTCVAMILLKVYRGNTSLYVLEQIKTANVSLRDE